MRPKEIHEVVRHYAATRDDRLEPADDPAYAVFEGALAGITRDEYRSYSRWLAEHHPEIGPTALRRKRPRPDRRGRSGRRREAAEHQRWSRETAAASAAEREAARQRLLAPWREAGAVLDRFRPAG